MSERKDRVIGLLVLVAFPATAIAAAHLLDKPKSFVIQGQVEAREVDVASKVPGRVMKIAVSEGQHVESGDLMVEIDCPEIQAKMAQAEAARDAAQAQHRKARRGARAEEILRARRSWEGAESVERMAKLTLDRITGIYENDAISAQKRDEVETQWRIARDRTSAAKALYDMTKRGARREDIDAAKALENQASAAIDEVRIAFDETTIRAPIAGEVAVVVMDEGELVAQGFPIITLIDLDDQWVTFNVREDHLSRFSMGKSVMGKIPALNQREMTFKVTRIAVQADFATVRATHASGDFDLHSFEVQAKPMQPIEGLRPGMSVIIPMPVVDE